MLGEYTRCQTWACVEATSLAPLSLQWSDLERGKGLAAAWEVTFAVTRE